MFSKFLEFEILGDRFGTPVFQEKICSIFEHETQEEHGFDYSRHQLDEHDQSQ
jgi:hypothetical protein